MNFVLLLPDVPGTLVMLRREIGKSLPLDSSRSPTTPHPHVRNRRLDKCHQTHASDTRRMPKKLPKLGSIAREVIFRFSGSRLRECSRSTEHRRRWCQPDFSRDVNCCHDRAMHHNLLERRASSRRLFIKRLLPVV